MIMRFQLFHGTSERKAKCIEENDGFIYSRIDKCYFDIKNQAAIKNLIRYNPRELPGTIGYGVYAFNNKNDALEFSIKRERNDDNVHKSCYYYVSFEVECESNEFLDCDTDDFQYIANDFLSYQSKTIINAINFIVNSIGMNSKKYKDVGYGIFIEILMVYFEQIDINIKILKKKTQTKKNNVCFLNSCNYTNTIEYCIRNEDIIDKIDVKREERKNE